MPSAFLANHRALIGTALTAPASNEYPQTDTFMYWPTGVTKSWPSGDLANYNRHKEMWGARNPQVVRLYQNSPFNTTGVNGSGSNSGTYGFIRPDDRAIANDGCFLNYTFKDGPASGWQGIADSLNATGDNAVKQRYRLLAQNLRHWYYDTGNTAAVKKIFLGDHHEPDNDGGTAAAWIAMNRAVITYLAKRGVGDLEFVSNDANAKVRVTLDSATAPGGAVTTFLDVFEWQAVIVGDTDARFAYWPGDDYCRWMMNDPYCWGGGQSSPGTNGGSGAHIGRVPQPGDTSGTNYGKPWRALKKTVGVTALLKWSDAHPDVLLGLGEFATSEFVDQFTGGANATLRTPKIASALPGAKGDWYKGVAKMARGEGYTSTIHSENTFAADARCKRIKCLQFWHDQAAMPRWFNTVPFQPGDINEPSTTGAARSLSYDGFVAMVNDPWFDALAGPPSVVDPSNLTLVPTVDNSGREYTFTSSATPGTGTITGFTFDFGDGSSETVTGVGPATVTHFYPTDGPRTVRVTVTASDGGEAAREASLTVTGRNEEHPEIEPMSGAPLIIPGITKIAHLASVYNPAVAFLAQFTHERTTRRLLKVISGTTYTLTPDDAGRTIEFTSETAVTVTIPANATAAFPFGAYVDLVQAGAGTVSVAGATGVSVLTPSAAATRARYSTIRLTQRSILNTWVLSGDLSAGTGTTPPPGGGITPTVDDLWVIDFNTGPTGAEVELADGFTSRDTTAVAMTYSTDALEGAYSGRVNTTNARTSYRKDITPAALVWQSIYFKLDALARTSTYVLEWYNGTNKVGDIKINSNDSLTLRDNIGAVNGMTSPALVPGAWTRVAVKVQPGSSTGHTLKVYQGDNLHTMTATFEASGAATSNGQTQVDTFRTGVLAATTALHRVDRWRGNSTVEPSPIAA